MKSRKAKQTTRFLVTILVLLMIFGFSIPPAQTVQAASATAALPKYDRNAAVAWANSDNYDDGSYRSNVGRWCTTYVTKAMRAGGIDVPVYSSNADLATWLRNHPDAWELRSKEALEKGDFIFLQKNGSIPVDLNISFIDHIVLVTEPGKFSQWNAERKNKNFSWFRGVYSDEKGIHLKVAAAPTQIFLSQIPSGYRFCANENGYCSFSGSQDIVYGATDKFVIKNANNGVDCNNSYFTDPNYGVAKACYVKTNSPITISQVPSGYSFCANENGYCSFSGAQDVIYGANDKFVTKTATNGVDCSNSYFTDPNHGVAKACFIKTPNKVISTVLPGGYNTYCADENGVCTISGTYDVAYGANGRYYIIPNQTGSIDCNNGMFGDPISGVYKSCYIHR